MAKVITTPQGDLLTSKVNAASLTRGDQIVLSSPMGVAVLTVFSVNTMVLDPGQRWVEFQPPDGYRFGLPFGINEPLDRVTGSRSGGIIGGL